MFLIFDYSNLLIFQSFAKITLVVLLPSETLPGPSYPPIIKLLW